MNNIELSFRNLIKTNNGVFKSTLQATFLLSKANDNEYCVSAKSFNKNWIDVFTLDEIGVISLTRHNNSGNVVEKWNRNGNSETQIKNKKSLEKYNEKINIHNAITIDAEKLYNNLCLATFGYVVCPEMKDKCWSAISIFENKSLIKIIEEEFNESFNNFSKSEKFDEFIIIYAENTKQFIKYKDMYKEFSTKLMKIRCDVQQSYPSVFPFKFM